MLTAWTAADGAPSEIHALAQTKDGFLWVGASDGLYRFDGVRFERFESPSWTNFPSHYAGCLFALPDGDLWIGFQSGVISVVRNGGAITNFTRADGAPAGMVKTFAQDREGTMWVSTSGGLARLEGNRWRQVGADWNFPASDANALFVDQRGTLWVATETTIVFLPAGAKQFHPTGLHIGDAWQIAQAPDGRLWMAETENSVRPVPLSTGQDSMNDLEINVKSFAILFDREGALWITTPRDGIRRATIPDALHGKIGESSDALEIITSKDGLSSDRITCILQDREGNVWLGTRNGIDRFRVRSIVPITSHFPPGDSVIAAGDGGDLWLGSGLDGRVGHLHGGRIYPGKQLDPVYEASRTPDGAIYWFGLYDIYRFEKGHFTKLALPTGFVTPYKHPSRVAESHSGQLWLAAGHNGLFRWIGGHWVKLDDGVALDRSDPTASFTDWMGRVWFGYQAGNIVALNERGIERFSGPQQSPVGSVRAIAGGPNHVWVGGAFGLALFQGESFRRIEGADAFPGGYVFDVIERPEGDLWLCVSKGVLHISSGEVKKVLDNPDYRMKYELFESADGLPGTFSNALTPSPKEVQGTDGRIWFATENGIAWIDPVNIERNTLRPPVVIRSLSADGNEYGSPVNLRLPALTRRIQINYTGLSLSVPERVRFRYKLEGTDKDWEDAGTRRAAFYNSLRPGDYRFRVIACNNDGVWNEQGATLDFNIAPAWYQTRLFLASCIAAGLLLALALHQIRMRHLARQLNLRFDERLGERTRIARELHDTLLQTIQGSKMVAEQALKASADPPRMHRALHQLSEWLEQATQEGRAALNSLRISATDRNDLAEAFQRALEDCRRQSSISVSFSVTGNSREMHPVVRDEVYRIGYEAIRNACAHSHASQLNVQLIYAQDVTLRVADNGVGIDPAIVDRGRAGHYGLQGMQERAGRIGSKLSINGSMGFGTEITVIVPGRVIFRKPTDPFPRTSDSGKMS